MRIAVWHNLPSGGAKRALFNHVRGLVGAGHSVEVWCPPTADRTYLPLKELVPEHVVPLDWPIADSLLDFWQVTLQTQRALAAMEAHCQACLDEIGRGRFDVVFANSCAFFAVPPIGRLAPMPSVLYLQEPYRRLYEAMPRLCWVARPDDRRPWWDIKRHRAAFADLRTQRNMRLQARHEVDNAAAFERILVNSYFSRESLLRSYGVESTVCHLGIDHEHFRFSEGERDDMVVSMGEMSPHKNACFVVEAIAALPEPRPKLTWICNKQTSYGDKTRALAAELGVALDIRFRVHDAELPALLGKATAMAYAPRLEPFGLAPLEANACGTPVVAAAEGGVRETVVDGVTGLLVDPTPKAMAEGLQRLRMDKALSRKLGRQAHEAVLTRWGLTAANKRLEAELATAARAVARTGDSGASCLPAA